ncbi:MAG: type I secretion system permease/ATPase [Comamonadaceae bacterium]|nr:type I secretion system permease/ATPase [Comamonadaceae bacterium]
MGITGKSSELRGAVADLRPYWVRAGWFSLVASLLVLMPSWYMLEVYDRVVNSRSAMTLAMVTFLAVGAYVVMEVLEWARAQIMFAAGVVLDENLRGRLFVAIFAMNLRRQPGGTTQPMTDLRTLREFLHSPVMLGLMEVPTSLVFLVLIFLINPLLGWVTVGAAVLQVLVGWLNERCTQPPLSEANQFAIQAQQYVDGTLLNAQVIESMGMVHDIHRCWMTRQQQFLSLQALASDRAGGYQAISKMLQYTVSSALLGLSCWLLLRNELRGGAAMLIISGIFGGRVLAPFVQAITQWRTVVNVREAWVRLDKLLVAMPAKAPTMPLPAPKGFLQVQSLSAAAPNSNQPILKNLSFALGPGDVLAVVGPSAAGKTTLARMLVGVWPALGGKVRLDGADVFAWDKSELGSHVGYLPQGVELFDGTLAENIARFGVVDMTRVRAAAQAVGLHELIMAMPLGYDSPVGIEGAILSGGQRQRVGLARAIYGDPVLVVLDEPNSSLDEAGETALTNAIRGLKAIGSTCVVMTHRTAVLAVADKMLVLSEGQLRAFGLRDEVLAALHKASKDAAPGAQFGPHQMALAGVK